MPDHNPQSQEGTVPEGIQLRALIGGELQRVPSDHPNAEWVWLDDFRDRLKEVERQRDEAIKSKEFTQQWYAERIRRLTDTAKREGIWEEVACILANGTGEVFEPPTYAQLLNSAKHRAERAEAALAERDRQVREALDFWGAEHKKVAEGAPGDFDADERQRARGAVELCQRLRESLLTQPSSTPLQQDPGVEEDGAKSSGVEEGEKRVGFQYHPECLEAENVREFHPEIVGAATGALRTMLDPEKDERAHRDADVLASCAVSEALKALVTVATLTQPEANSSLSKEALDWAAANMPREPEADPEVPRCEEAKAIRDRFEEQIASRRAAAAAAKGNGDVEEAVRLERSANAIAHAVEMVFDLEPDCQSTPELLGEEGTQ